MVTEAVIERLVDGVWSKIVVCRVDPVIAVAPRARPTADLYLSRETLLHVLDEHKVPVEDLTLLADAVNRGLVIAERKRARFATICYQSEVEGKRYIAPIKATVDGSEMYVMSFHRSRDGQTKSLLKRGEAIRFHQ